MTQLVKHPTLGFGSGHYLVVCVFEPHVGLPTDSTEPASDSLSPSLFAPPLFMLTLERKKGRKKERRKKKKETLGQGPAIHGLVSSARDSNLR